MTFSRPLSFTLPMSPDSMLARPAPWEFRKSRPPSSRQLVLACMAGKMCSAPPSKLLSSRLRGLDIWQPWDFPCASQPGIRLSGCFVSACISRAVQQGIDVHAV